MFFSGSIRIFLILVIILILSNVLVRIIGWLVWGVPFRSLHERSLAPRIMIFNGKVDIAQVLMVIFFFGFILLIAFLTRFGYLPKQ